MKEHHLGLVKHNKLVAFTRPIFKPSICESRDNFTAIHNKLVGFPDVSNN
jgi:hypothetical protein